LNSLSVAEAVIVLLQSSSMGAASQIVENFASTGNFASAGPETFMNEFCQSCANEHLGMSFTNHVRLNPMLSNKAWSLGNSEQCASPDVSMSNIFRMTNDMTNNVKLSGEINLRK